MSSTLNSDQEFIGPSNVRGFGYGIGVSIGILLLIIVVGLASYVCTKTLQRPRAPPSNSRDPAPTDSESFVLDVVGLDEETIKSYPNLRFCEAKLLKKDSTETCCSICLVDYKGKDSLRLLPNCGHFFHIKCVDHWLQLHPTCPVCRTSPIPTPLTDDLVIDVPLPSRPPGC